MRRAILAWCWLGLLLCMPSAQARDGPALHDGSAIPAVAAARLPPEARETLRLVEQGGPFPYARDGIVFGNREHRLPEQPRGYYREYTVKTPGERSRGARRIVCGQASDCYYSADHYRSFRRITGRY
jgi:ribonuclease T1